MNKCNYRNDCDVEVGSGPGQAKGGRIYGLDYYCEVHEAQMKARVAELRTKRVSGQPLTPEEQSELLDILLGVF